MHDQEAHVWVMHSKEDLGYGAVVSTYTMYVGKVCTASSKAESVLFFALFFFCLFFFFLSLISLFFFFFLYFFSLFYCSIITSAAKD